MKTLLIDIETAPNRVYTWGLFNQNISLNQVDKPGYILCWAAKWLDNKKVMFESVQNQSNAKMLSPIYDLLNEADAIIHYNGNSFDIKWLHAEFLKLGWAMPAPSQHIDLLPTVKRRFRLASNKLDYVLGFLGLGEKVKHEGFDMWVGCMEGDKKYWKMMEKYNRGDVTQMEKVYRRLLGWIVNHPNHGVYGDAVAPTCPNCGGTHVTKRGPYSTATMTYQRYQCQDCGTWSKDRTGNLDKSTRPNVLKGL